jgi:hypothetical protein
MESQVSVKGLSGREVTDLMVACDDARYQEWWPGTHRAFHVLRSAPGEHHVGDLVWMDEFVGSRHLRMAAEVLEVVPGEKVAWRLRPGRLRLPVRLTLTLRDHDGGVLVRHTLTAGWAGWARVFDPLWRLYFTDAFAAAMDGHAKTEFLRLGHLVHPEHQQHSSEPTMDPHAAVAPYDEASP